MFVLSFNFWFDFVVPRQLSRSILSWFSLPFSVSK